MGTYRGRGGTKASTHGPLSVAAVMIFSFLILVAFDADDGKNAPPPARN